MRVSGVVDYVFVRLVVLAGVFVWVRFYARNLLLSLFIAVIVTALFCVATALLFKKRRARIALTKQEQAKMRECINQFVYNAPEFQRTFFHNLLCGRHKVDCHAPYLLIDENTLLLSKLSLSRISAAELCTAAARAKELSVSKLIFFGETEKDFFTVAKMFEAMSFTVYGEREVFALMKRYNTFPAITIKIARQRLSPRDFLPIILHPQRARGFLMSALLLILGSIFMPYTVYYAITASILLVLAALCKRNLFNAPSKLPQDF